MNSHKRYKIVLVENSVRTSENLFGFEKREFGSETDNKLIFEKITKELEADLHRESDDTDWTDGVFNFLVSLSDQFQEEFEEILDGDGDKVSFS